jgi:hypothetical protein
MKETKSYVSYMKSKYKSIKHSTYFDSYDHFFNYYRGKEITFVEIGVLGGGSLFMWRDYFGPKARIIGVDLNPNAKKWEEHGFEIYIGNQSDENFWKAFNLQVGGIDIVLDDGGHTYDQQIITTEMLLNQIKSGGILVVEDTHTSYMHGFGPRKYSFIEYVKKKIDQTNHRFGELSNLKSEKRIWSIEILESMVAFKVNLTASNLLSTPTDNKGIDDQAKDFRYEDNLMINKINLITNKLYFLKFIPFTKIIAKFLRFYIANNKFRSKKYFR